MSRRRKKAAPAGTRDGSKKVMGVHFQELIYRAVSFPTSDDLETLVRRVFAAHGMGAMEMPKFDACVHEAGHAVLFAAEGEPVREVSIFCRRYLNRRQWGGNTAASSPWTAHPASDPVADLRRARFTIAGLTAEMVHLGDGYRKGSSLDELLTAKRLCNLASSKVGRSVNELLCEQFTEVEAVLKRFWPETLLLAITLDRRHQVTGVKLEEMLRPVREAVQ
jgi:hypothetical protein